MAPPNGQSSTYGRSRQTVAAPTQPADRVALYTYPSSAALYSQLPISEAALAPISARAPRIAKTSRYGRTVDSPIAHGQWSGSGVGGGEPNHLQHLAQEDGAEFASLVAAGLRRLTVMG